MYLDTRMKNESSNHRMNQSIAIDASAHLFLFTSSYALNEGYERKMSKCSVIPVPALADNCKKVKFV